MALIIGPAENVILMTRPMPQPWLDGSENSNDPVSRSSTNGNAFVDEVREELVLEEADKNHYRGSFNSVVSISDCVTHETSRLIFHKS